MQINGNIKCSEFGFKGKVRGNIECDHINIASEGDLKEILNLLTQQSAEILSVMFLQIHLPLNLQPVLKVTFTIIT